MRGSKQPFPLNFSNKNLELCSLIRIFPLINGEQIAPQIITRGTPCDLVLVMDAQAARSVTVLLLSE